MHQPRGTQQAAIPPVQLQQSTCNKCRLHIRQGVNRLLCATERCDEECHKNLKCSGIGRYARSQRWLCDIHDEHDRMSTPGGYSRHPPLGDEPDAPDDAPADAPRMCESSDEHDRTSAPRKCEKCKLPIRRDFTPIPCAGCKKPHHKSCTGLQRAAVDAVSRGDQLWMCPKCERDQEPRNSLNQHGGTATETADDAPHKPKKSLRIMQWNADGLSTKIDELRERLTEADIDVCIIQETKLRPNTKTPTIKGYASIRADRKSQDGGGGLISYIKDSLVFERIRDETKDGTETSTFKVKMGKRKWAQFCNLYCPPVRSHSAGQNIRLATESIPTSAESVILGDFNAHSPIWDLSQPSDARGETIEDWIVTNNLTVLNDGRHTRINRNANDTPTADPPATNTPRKGESAPDVSLCGETWSGRCTWEPSEGIGSSDHCPITITIATEINHYSVFQGQPKWKSKDVDWKAWADEVDNNMTNIADDSNITSRVLEFNKILTEAATVHIGKVKPGKKTKSWFTPTVQGAIRKRNHLRHQVQTKRREWIEACHDAQEEIRKAKEESWKDLLQETISSVDEAQMWRLVKSLNGSPDSNAPNEAMRHHGKLITSGKRKANIFVNHYAAVSDLTMSADDRAVNRRLKKTLREHRRHREDRDEVPDFTMPELKKAIKKMKMKGAPGPDDIPPSFLKNLGPVALQKLLDIFNLSFRSAACPQIWRNAIIIPILKAGKSAADIASFRPISLTSCAIKLLERMIAERLYFLAETKGWFSKFQAGFRKGRGCEDQILRLAQSIDDGFQHKPPKRSVMVLLDFSKAYDTVWRERLLTSMLQKGVPSPYILWLFSFLQNRQAIVRFNGVFSHSRKMCQGLPQGSVLAPILFLFYINELADCLPPEPVTSIYADDVTILTTAREPEEAQRAAQRTVDTVVAWSHTWKLNLNATKSEVSFFSRIPGDSNWEPTIRIDGNTIGFAPRPRLLGVILDRNLTFAEHTDTVVRKATAKLRMLGAVANTEWGWRKQDLRKVFLAHIRSVLDFAGCAWQPWLSKTNICKLERAQNKALRLITGQAKSSPVEALRAEADVSSFTSNIRANCMRSMEKAHRLPEDHPRKLAIASTIRQRLKRENWRKQATELASIFLTDKQYQRSPLVYFTTPPWSLGIGNTQVFPSLPGISGRNDEEEVKLEAALHRIRDLGCTFAVYPDGSASAGTVMGGSGAVITNGDPARPNVLATLQKKGAMYTCSYEEEAKALDLIIDWTDEFCTADDTIGVFTDSQSLCEALLSYTTNIDPLRSRLKDSKCTFTIQWIPGHSNIPGNELADAAAKAATELPGLHRPTSYGSICTAIKSFTGDGPPDHQRTRDVYRCISKDKEKLITSRSDQVLLAKLRSGHHIALRAYKNRIDGITNPSCPLCSEEEHSLEHWFTRCPGTELQRRRLFGEDFDKLECLTKSPLKAVALARQTLGALG
jgi:ribonuclease HI